MVVEKIQQNTGTGGTWYIIGGGHSLLEELNVPIEVQDKVKQVNDLSLLIPYAAILREKKVIAVNMAYTLAPWAPVVFFGDEGFWKNNTKQLQAHQGLKVSTNSRFRNSSEVQYIERDKIKRFGLSKNHHSLCWNNNSGACAIDLAVHMGAEKVVLLGFDMQLVEGKSHWHQAYPHQNNNPYLRHLKGFPDIAADAKQKGVEIVNCSTATALTVFPIGKLLEHLKKPSKTPKNAKKRHIIITVTPTCSPERKPFVDFCKKRLSEQTRKPDQTVFIDYPNTTGVHDLVERYQQGIERAFALGADLVVFIEDDDFYPKTYIEELEKAWVKEGKPVLIGCNTTRYYHLFSLGYSIMKTNRHASAHGTAVGKGCNYMVGKHGNPFYDIQLWQHNAGVLVDLGHPPISIKHHIGLSGGRGHYEDEYKNYDKPEAPILKEWVDEEGFAFYQSIREFYMKQAPAPLSRGEWISMYLKKIGLNINARIHQGYVSTTYPKRGMLTAYGLRTYDNKQQPLIIFGFRTKQDYRIAGHNNSFVVIIWTMQDVASIPVIYRQSLQKTKYFHMTFDKDVLPALYKLGITCFLADTLEEEMLTARQLLKLENTTPKLFENEPAGN